MTDDLKQVRVEANPTLEAFHTDIIPSAEPVLLKGLVKDWPSVAAGRQSDESLADYMTRFNAGKPVETIFGAPSIAGRFFYSEDMQSLNFDRKPAPIKETIDHILSMRDTADPPSLYIQSAPIPEYLPGFQQENRLDFVAPSIAPRIWIGNQLTVQTHFDLSENIACVIAGRRRFTLFPPEQLPNLYPGPFELTLAGPPVSMVRLDTPDYERYPKFKDALAHAQTADLEPGDAIYIPYFWWHHVESLDRFNVLVNYWWNDAEPDLGSPFDCLLHGLLALRDMPPRYREVWRMMFDHYVFKKHGEPVAHLPPEARGALGARDPRKTQKMRMMLLQSLAREAGLKPPAPPHR